MFFFPEMICFVLAQLGPLLIFVMSVSMFEYFGRYVENLALIDGFFRIKLFLF